jgi:hypothetical protein
VCEAASFRQRMASHDLAQDHAYCRLIAVMCCHALAMIPQVAAMGGPEALPQHPLPHIPHPPPQLPSLRQLAAAADAWPPLPEMCSPKGRLQATA